VLKKFAFAVLSFSFIIINILQSIRTAQEEEVLTFTIYFKNACSGFCFKLLVFIALVTKIREVTKEFYY